MADLVNLDKDVQVKILEIAASMKGTTEEATERELVRMEKMVRRLVKATFPE